MAIVGFVIFDVLAVAFLLWCLGNFIREGRRYKGAHVNVMQLDPVRPVRDTNVVDLRVCALQGGQRRRRVHAMRDSLLPSARAEAE